MIFVVLHKYSNCAVDKTIDSRHTTSTDCNTKYKIILFMVLFIISWSKPLKTYSSRKICSYATIVKFYVSATTQLKYV